MLSMGFGFVELTSAEVAKRALRKFQGVQLKGHAMDLRVSVRTSSAESRIKQKKRKRADEAEMVDAKGKKKTKLIVRNLAFEANKKELRSLLQRTPEIRSTSRKFDGKHRICLSILCRIRRHRAR